MAIAEAMTATDSITYVRVALTRAVLVVQGAVTSTASPAISMVALVLIVQI